jgi:hypothetical protein
MRLAWGPWKGPGASPVRCSWLVHCRHLGLTINSANDVVSGELPERSVAHGTLLWLTDTVRITTLGSFENY